VPVRAPADVPTLTVGTPDEPAPAEVTATAGPPQAPDPAAGAPGPGFVVDAKIGDINGRPVYASDILDNNLGPRLLQTAREDGMTRERWTDEARRLIADELFKVMRDELIAAEARASLRPPQKQGLRSMLQEWREEERRRVGGAAALLEERLRQENKTVEQWLREREAAALIQYEFEQRIQKRAIVTWQDIRLYYERNFKVYNPDPLARFRLVRVVTSRAEDLEAVRSALDRGEPFEAVAAMEANTFNRETGGVVERPFAGEYAEGEFFGVPELNAAARALSPGEWTREPVTYGAFTAWLKLDSVEQISRPLSRWDVQLEILRILADHKRDEEMRRYLGRLMERASFTSLSDMTDQLLRIAGDRYWRGR
jgi:hypothetical protein